MKRILILLFIVSVAFFLVKFLAEAPERAAKGTVKDFIEEIKEGKVREAAKLLSPSFRESFNTDLYIDFAQMKPSEVIDCLAYYMGERMEPLECVLYYTGKKIKDMEILDVKKIDNEGTIVLTKIIYMHGTDKTFTFTLIKEDKKWKIAGISGVK